MMSLRNPMVVLAAAAAVVTGILTYLYLGSLGGTAPVVVAAHDLTAPARLTAADVRVQEMPVRAIHPQAYTDPTLVIGRYLLAPAVQGQVLLDPHLAPRHEGGPIAFALSPGYSAIFVPLSTDRGLGGAVSPGDWLDLLLISRGLRSDGPPTHSLIRGVRVLEVRDEMGRRYDPGARGSSVPAGVLVEVSPDDAVRLAVGMEQGSVYAMISSLAAGDGGE